MSAPTKPQRAGDQPLPHDGQVDVGPAVVADVLSYADFHGETIVRQIADDFRARIQLGIERYGHPLQTNNGRDAARDALDELEDAAHYLKQLHLETGDAKTLTLYWSALGNVFHLKEWMAEHEARVTREAG